MVSSPFSDSGTPKNRRFVRLEYCSSWSRSASHEDSLASRAAIYWCVFYSRSLSCDIFSLNMSSSSVRAFGLSTWRSFWTTASSDKSSTNLTSRASSFGPISAVSEALSPLRLGGMMGSNYFKTIRHKLLNSLPRSKRCHTSAAILFRTEIEEETVEQLFTKRIIYGDNKSSTTAEARAAKWKRMKNKSFIRLPPDADSLRQHCLRASYSNAPPVHETPPLATRTWLGAGGWSLSPCPPQATCSPDAPTCTRAS